MYIHYVFDIIMDRRLIVNVVTKQKKKVLYDNELINDENDCNVNKKNFIFCFLPVNWYGF